jgi:probable rRNA maturation factor
MVIIKKSVAGLTEASLTHFVRHAARVVRLRGSVTVLLTTNNEMRSLNLRFRGKSAPTDVLSFPPLSPLPVGFAGDIAISAEMAAQNARRFGHSAADEVRILALHGLMHLAGYNHECDSGTMARKEQRLRKSLHLPIGLIERNAVDYLSEGNGVGVKASSVKPGASHSGRATPTAARRQR